MRQYCWRTPKFYLASQSLLISETHLLRYDIVT